FPARSIQRPSFERSDHLPHLSCDAVTRRCSGGEKILRHRQNLFHCRVRPTPLQEKNTPARPCRPPHVAVYRSPARRRGSAARAVASLFSCVGSTGRQSDERFLSALVAARGLEARSPTEAARL